MPADLVALKTALETDPKYDTLVRQGSNGLLWELLNREDTALPKRWRPIPMSDFLDIMAAESLTQQQEQRINSYVTLGRDMPLNKQAIRTWLQATVTQTTKDALIAAGQITGKLGDAFSDEDSVSLRDVREVVRQIPKSLIRSTGQA